MRNEELQFIAQSMRAVVENIDEWEKDYSYDPHTNEFRHHLDSEKKNTLIDSWFHID